MKNRILSALLAGAILLVTACSDSSSQDSQTGSLTEASSAESGTVSSQPEEELSSVTFSHQSGVYSEEFSLTVSANDGAEILLTEATLRQAIRQRCIPIPLLLATEAKIRMWFRRLILF